MNKLLTGKSKLVISSVLLVASLTVIFVNRSRASDATIICGNTCSGPGSALFNETNIFPGQTISKTVDIKNERNKAISLTLLTDKKIGSDDNYLEKINVVIKTGSSTTLFDNNLKQLIQTDLPLGSIASNSTKNYVISLELPATAGNDYQHKNANFDFKFNISGEDEDSSSTTSDTTGGDGNDGGSESDSSTADSPQPTPTLATTSTIIPSILGTFDQEFQLYDEVLGSETSLEESVQQGEVLGEICQDNNYWWWLPLVIQLILGSVYALKLKKKPQAWWLPLLGLALLSQIIHWLILPCNCATSSWCHYYHWFNLGTVVVNLLSGMKKK